METHLFNKLLISYILPVLFLSCIAPFNSYSQWEWQNPLPQGNNLSWIQFVNPNTAFAVGDKGTIMKTTDKGLTWHQIYTGIWPDLTGIYFVNEMVGYAVGADQSAWLGYCFKTVDGGETWSELPYVFLDQALCVWFLDENTGFVGTFWALYKTTDGGNTWSILSPPPTYTTYWSIFFTDDLNGYLGGMDKIYKTEDGGDTWNVSYYDPDAVHLTLFFPTHDTGFAVDRSGIILKTIDGGQNWLASTQSDPLSCIFFSSPQNGIITGSNYIHRTTDGGTSWQLQLNPVSDYLLAGAFADAQNAIVVGTHGSTIITNDVGVSWQAQSSYITTRRLKSLTFTTPEIGYAAGDSGIILKTGNGGDTWQSCFSGTSNLLESLYFVTPQIGYVSGLNTILKTTDAGINWILLYSTSDFHFFSTIQFPSPSIGYCFYGGVLKTLDAGATWNEIASAGIYNNSMFFTSPDVGYLCASDGEIRKTTDGGNTFTTLNSGVSIDLKVIYFVSNSTGFALGNNLIIRTTDGGNNWQTVYSGSFRPWGYNNINFSDPLHGVFICWDTILSTKDGGESFQAISTGNYYIYPVDAIWFIDSLTGYISGDNGSILKTTTGGIITGIKNRMPVDILQVFPNPNEGCFYFNFKPEQAGNIEVYSMTGKLLYKSSLSEHSTFHKIILNNVKKGMYILKVNDSNCVLTSKIIVQ